MKDTQKKRIRPMILIAAAVLLFAIIPAAGVGSGFEQNNASVLPGAKNAVPGATVTFSQKDFSQNITDGEKLLGILVTALPSAKTGILKLGSREVYSGDTIMSDELSKLTFEPVSDNETTASFRFVPVFKSGKTSGDVEMKINLLKSGNKAPTAEAMTVETLRSVRVIGIFEASDPEADEVNFKVVSSPKKGTVVYDEKYGRSFTYIPSSGITGSDSFTYCAVDERGNVSKPAKVTLKIKGTNASSVYADLEGSYAYYPAVSLSEKGVFSGEKIAGTSFFLPG